MWLLVLLAVAPDTPVTRRLLARDERIGKLTCKAGTELGVDAKNRPVFCTVAKAVEVDGLPVAAGAYTLFHPNGRIFQTTLARATRHVLANGTKVSCQAGLVSLTETGRLTFCDGVGWHPSGRVASRTLEQPLDTNGVHLPAGAFARWNDDGALIGGSVSAPLKLGTLEVISEFDLWPGGAARFVELAKTARVQGHDFPRGATLGFDAAGRLEHATYLLAEGFLPHGAEWSDTRHVLYGADGGETDAGVEHWQGKDEPMQ